MNMQKISVHTLMCLLACATTACSNDLEQKEIPVQGEGEGERITVTATAGMTKGEPSTRVKFEDITNGGVSKLKLSWRPIDDPKGTETFSVLYPTNTAEPTGSTTLSTFTMQSLEEGDNATFTGEIIVNPGTTYYAVYPALTADADAPATDVAATTAADASADAAVSPAAVSPTAIPLDMTGQKGDTYDESKTYMYSSCTYATTDKLKFNFKPLTSILEVTLQFPAAVADESIVEKVRFSATDGLYKSANVDITKSSATYNDKKKAGYLELSNSFALSAKETKVYLHLLPGDLKKFEVSAVVNGTIYISTISASTEIVAGKMYTNTVKMEKDPLADAQIGDFYCVKDGNGYLIPGDATLTGDQKKECIGIVFGVGNKALEQDSLLRRDHADCSHGLVVALQDATLDDGTNKMNWNKDGYESVQDKWVTPSDKYNSTVVNLKATDKLCGYSNTLALMAYNAAKDENDKLRVLPCDAIQKYSNDKLAPINSSGWYLPSVMELKYVCWGWGETSQSTVGKGKINDQIGKVGGSSVFGSDDYWSSTEGSNSNRAWSVYFDHGSVDYSNKNLNAFPVRPILAF